METVKRKNSVRKPEGKKTPFPERVEPMLCQLVEQVPDSEDYQFEVKLDGYRITAHVRHGKAMLKTRSGLNYSKRYLQVTKAVQALSTDVVFDGEIVAVNEEGKHDFTLLQRYNRTHEGRVLYYLFDILWLNGYNLMQLPLTKRKEILNNTIQSNEIIRIVDTFDEGQALFKKSLVFGFEGIVCKKKQSPYIPGDRSRYWVKVKHKKSDEFIIVGYIPSASRQSFKTLLLGKYTNGRLHYIHHSGGGYTEQDKKELFPRLKKTIVKKPPVVNLGEVLLDDEPTWVRPVIVGEFRREEKSYKSGRQRHPIIFMGIREDKRLHEVIKEKPLPALKKTTPGKKPAAKKENTEDTTATWADVENRPVTTRKKVTIEGKKLELVNLEKKLWHNITKEDLHNYYKVIAPFMLPYLMDRPMALNVALHGPHAKTFFLRGLEGHYPAWADVFTTKRKHKRNGKSPYIEWLVCNNVATLMYIINLECIDLHPWGSRTTLPDFADYIVIDLDPTIPDSNNDEERKQLRNNGFIKAMITALSAKEFFDKHKIQSFVKTSGKTGIHLYLPCQGFEYGDQKNKGQPRIIAENICNEIHALTGDITTTSYSQGTRGDKLYLDPNQNDFADRVAVAYCVRATHKPLISTPLEWHEVNKRLSPEKFTIHNMINRVKKKGDVWKNLFDRNVIETNSKALRSFL